MTDIPAKYNFGDDEMAEAELASDNIGLAASRHPPMTTTSAIHTPTPDQIRLKVARIIDPSAWLLEDGYWVEQEHSSDALLKADEILATTDLIGLRSALYKIAAVENLRTDENGISDIAPSLSAAEACLVAQSALAKS